MKNNVYPFHLTYVKVREFQSFWRQTGTYLQLQTPCLMTVRSPEFIWLTSILNEPDVGCSGFHFRNRYFMTFVCSGESWSPMTANSVKQVCWSSISAVCTGQCAENLWKWDNLLRHLGLLSSSFHAIFRCWKNRKQV